MLNNVRQAGTNAQQSTNDELLPSAPLLQNPLLCDVAFVKVLIVKNNGLDDLKKSTK